METKVKYPRTPHVPWSPGLKDPQERMSDLKGLLDQEVVVTAKMDGENTTFYNDAIHARSLDYSPHPSRNRIKAFHSTIKHSIPQGYRICLENLYATHSIHYNNLPAYWLGLSVWNEANICLSWPDTLEWFQLLNILPVPSLYEGKFNIELLKTLYKPTFNNDQLEGYVIRLRSSFHYNDFKNSVAKYVRPNHVQTDQHWINQPVIPNELDDSVPWNIFQFLEC